MNSKTTLFVAVLVSSASVLVACAAPGASDAVAVDVSAGQVDTACIKGELGCKPPRTNTGGRGDVAGDLSGAVVNANWNDIDITGGGNTGSGGVRGNLGGTFGEPYQVMGPTSEPPFQCEGPGPLPNTFWFLERDGQCWLVSPIEIDGGIPSGYNRISVYSCPYSAPVLRCNNLGSCACWTY